MATKGIQQIKFVILVLSGKGGVGKSTVSVQLALALQQAGFKVGLLDIDICGPSIPKMLSLMGQQITQGESGWNPIRFERTDGRHPEMLVMSIGFLLNPDNPDAAVIWRGPRKNAMIRQFLTDVDWGQNLDYLVIDTPPGTSDEHITIVECLREFQTKCGALLVTTPQSIAVSDVRREITFCRKGNIEILGLVENMSGYVCQHCSECTNLFSSGGGKLLAEHAQLELLASIPVEPALAQFCDNGPNASGDFIEKFHNSLAYDRIQSAMKKICQKTRDSDFVAATTT